jgi:hypothetical protein
MSKYIAQVNTVGLMWGLNYYILILLIYNNYLKPVSGGETVRRTLVSLFIVFSYLFAYYKLF